MPARNSQGFEFAWCGAGLGRGGNSRKYYRWTDLTCRREEGRRRRGAGRRMESGGLDLARWWRPRPCFKILSSAPLRLRLRLRPFCLRSARRGSQAQGGEGWVSRACARACVRAICPGQFGLKKFKRLTRAGELKGGGAGARPRGCPVRGSDSRIRRFSARLGDFLRRIAAGARVSMGSRGERHVVVEAVWRGGEQVCHMSS